MLLGIFAALAVLGLAALFFSVRASVRADRSARANPAHPDAAGGSGARRDGADPGRPPDDGTAGRPAVDRGGAVGALHRLDVGARVEADQRTWRVLGTTAAGDGAWTAWHLEEQGQRGLLVVDADDPEHVVIAVGAEDVDGLDPDAGPVVWRHIEWEPAGPDAGTDERPFTARGTRQRWFREEPLPAVGTVRRRRFANPTLPKRRLTFLRVTVAPGAEGEVAEPAVQRLSGGDVGAWDTWIGDALPRRQVDVFSPVAGEPDAA